ncbi:MAG: glycosyltransferase family 4 protein [Pseudomonadota bacterium]
MRIAYVINSVEGGGAASPVPAVTQVMRRCGAAVRVFALTRRDGRALPPMEAAGLDPLVRAGGLHDHVAAIRWLAAETRRWGATHLWTSLSRATILGLLLSRWKGLPVICWQHAAFLKPGNRRLLRALQSQARLWVADSSSVAELTASRLNIGPDRLVTWPIFAADPASPVAPPWMPGEPIRIGSLGRLHPVKGYDVLMNALSLLHRDGYSPPARLQLTIAGEGAERSRIEALARDACLAQLQMPGYVDDPRSFLAGQHLYVQPSRSEGFCIGVHEAMVAGLPVLASAVGEIGRTVQQDVSGFLVPPNDPHALAVHLKALLSDPSRLATLGTAGRKQVLTQYSQQQFVSTGEAILSRIAVQNA